MPSRIYTLTVDCHEPAALASFWADLLGWEVEEDDEDVDPEEVAVAPKGADDTIPALLFLKDPNAKSVKNRLHLDLAPDDQDAEIERAIALGASRVDIGQGGEESWVVLADPAGNEFCILSAR